MRILRIHSTKSSGYHFYMNANTKGGFQICISVPLSANPKKWSNTLKQFVSNLPTNCLSVFDHFVKSVLKGLKSFIIALKSVTGLKLAMPDIVKQLRKEMLTKHDFYRQFSSADVNILQELEPNKIFGLKFGF